MKKDCFLIVNSEVLPSVFSGVILAKELLKNGTASNTSQAAKMAGISRSAFYKYRNFVFKYDGSDSAIFKLAAVLSDRAGVFSAMTAILYENGFNIVTVNQEAPLNGTAAVTLGIKADNPNITINDLLISLKNVDGIVSVNEI